MATTLNLLKNSITNVIPLHIKHPFDIEQISTNVSNASFANVLMNLNDYEIISTEVALKELDDIKYITDPELKGLVLASIGHVQSFHGNYVMASSAFKEASKLVQTLEGYSFIVSSMACMLRNLNLYNHTIELIDSAIDKTTNVHLHNQLLIEKGLCYKYSDHDKSIAMLKESISFYKKTRHYNRVARLQKHIANIYDEKHEFNKAKKMYNVVLQYTKEHNLEQFQYEVESDMAWMAFMQEDYDKARSEFERLVHIEQSPYQTVLCLQNLGVVEYNTRHYSKAVKYHSTSLQITKKHEMRDMMFEDYYRLGLCHEKIGEIGLADHFYGLGYEELQEDIDIRMPLLGYRKKLLDKYISFLKTNQRMGFIDKDAEIFGFALGKSLQDIRDIFHTNYFNLQLEITKSAPELCNKLKIEKKTYFNYQKKLGLKRGLHVKTELNQNSYFMMYLTSLTDKTWREINEEFEADLLRFLLKKHQYNKKELASVLGLSYPYFVKMTT